MTRRGWLGEKEIRTMGMGGGQEEAPDAWNNAFSRKTRSAPVADGVHRRACTPYSVYAKLQVLRDTHPPHRVTG